MYRRALLTLVVALAAFAAIVISQKRLDTLRQEALDDELLYIPSKSILQHLTAGMSNIVADMLWIETIQYTVTEYHNPERKFAWLDHMLNATVELDPYFQGVYRHGGMFLSSIGSDDRALRLLQRGYANNPGGWEIPYEIVKLYTLNRRDDPASPAHAAHWLRIMAPHHKHPQLYLNWARQIEQQNNLGGQSRAIWEDVIVNATDPFVREVAKHNLRILVADDTKKALQSMMDRYRAERGHAPKSLDEFVKLGWIKQLPSRDEAGEFFFDANGNVESVVVLEDTRDRMLLGLNARLRVLAKDKGRKPANLEEISEWLGGPLAPHPVPGRQWTYNPETGAIS
jgi:hypothetical protein